MNFLPDYERIEAERRDWLEKLVPGEMVAVWNGAKEAYDIIGIVSINKRNRKMYTSDGRVFDSEGILTTTRSRQFLGKSKVKIEKISDRVAWQNAKMDLISKLKRSMDSMPKKDFWLIYDVVYQVIDHGSDKLKIEKT